MPGRRGADQRNCPKFEVFICENGGAAAFDALEKALSEKGAPCEGDVESVGPPSNDFVRARRLRLAGGGVPVTIGQASDNLGFAGAPTRGCGLCSPNRAGARSGFSTPTPILSPTRWRSSSTTPGSAARAWSEAA